MRPSAAYKRALLAIAIGGLVRFAVPPRLSAQTTTTDWENAAGRNMSFEAASVKVEDPNDSASHSRRSNFPLDNQEGDEVGGLLSASNFTLDTFIGFAYKLTPMQTQTVSSELPKWAKATRFDVEARALGSPTKDQMRLMMQSLLADRFKFVAHFENHEGSELALVLAKPGQTGPQLTKHSDDMPCIDSSHSDSPPALNGTSGGTSPHFCGVVSIMLGARGYRMSVNEVSMAQFASYLPGAPMTTLDRPVVDGTRLSGTFDIVLEWKPDTPIRLNGSEVQMASSAETFIEALKDQLGLKLQSIWPGEHINCRSHRGAHAELSDLETTPAYKEHAATVFRFASSDQRRIADLLKITLVPILFLAFVAGCSSVRMASQTPATTKEADAASLVGHNCNGQPKIQSGDGQFVLTDVSLRELIGEAYDLSFGEAYVLMTQPAAKLFGVSEWSGTSINNSRCYDINIQVSANSTLDQNLLILRSLLADRFKLKMHRTTQETPVYLLALAESGKTGPQLRRHMDDAVCDNPRASLPLPPGPYPTSPLPCRGGPYLQGNRLSAFDVDMDTLARFLTGGFMIDRPVLNETGLKGAFDFDLAPASGSKDSFIAGLASQLGLKLEPAIRDINLLVVDQIEEPSS